MSVYKDSEEFLQMVECKSRETWSVNNEFICHNIEKCGRYYCKSDHNGSNVDTIIKDTLEIVLWDLLNSKWFEAMRKKVCMEHTVKYWKRQDINIASPEVFLPTPDDEVPFYNRILTGDKPIKRQTQPKQEGWSLDAKLIKTPLKNIYTFYVIPDCGEGDVFSDNLIESFQGSKIKTKKVYPSTMSCHNIPSVVVSGIFEDLMSQLKLDLLGDCFEAEHDKID